MAKKSTSKSGSKKKSTAKKKTAAKKTAAKKSTAKSKATAKAKQAAKKSKTVAKKTTTKKQTKQKTVSANPLLKKFDTWEPETLFRPGTSEPDFSAPGFFDHLKKKEAGEMKKLLFRTFDLEAVAKPSKPAPKPGRKPTKKTKTKKITPTIDQLLKKSFPEWQPKTLFQPKTVQGEFTAPDFTEGLAESDASQIRSLLKKQFDLTAPTEPTTAEPQPESAPEPTTEPVSIAELILKKFPTWQPDALFEVEVEAGPFTAPAFFPDIDGAEADRIRSLLAKQFDLTAPAEPVPTDQQPEPAPEPPAEPVSIAELILKKFPTWQPDALFEVEVEAGPFTAPAFFPDIDGAEADRIRSLLAKQFDLTAPAEPVPTDQQPEPAPEPPAEPVSIAELIRRKFHTWQPDSLFKPEVMEGEYSAPPCMPSDDEAEKNRWKALLFKQFDLTAVIAEPTTESQTETKEEPVSEPETEAAVQQEASPEPKSVAEDAAKPEEITPEPKSVAEDAAKPEKVALESPQVEETAAKTVSEVKPLPEKMPAAEPEKETPPEKERETMDTKEQPEVKVTYDVEETKVKDPIDTTIKYLAGCLAALFIILLMFSSSNANKYYLNVKNGTLEIWKGIFAPAGTERVVALPGVPVPEEIKSVYTREDVFPLAFEFYMKKAQDLLDVKKTPNLQTVQNLLLEADKYAVTMSQTAQVRRQFANVRLMTQLQKADIAALKQDKQSLETAIAQLTEELGRELDANQKRLVEDKLNSLKSILAGLETPNNDQPAEKSEPETDK